MLSKDIKFEIRATKTSRGAFKITSRKGPNRVIEPGEIDAFIDDVVEYVERMRGEWKKAQHEEEE